MSGTAENSPIISFDGYVPDQETARLTAQANHAIAVLFAPKVIRLRDNRVLLCFKLLVHEPGLVKAYPPTSAEIEKVVIDDLATALSGGLTALKPGADPLLTRIDALERKLAELAASVMKSAASSRPTDGTRAYGTTRAVVIGINEYDDNAFPLSATRPAMPRQSAKPCKARGSTRSRVS